MRKLIMLFSFISVNVIYGHTPSNDRTTTYGQCVCEYPSGKQFVLEMHLDQPKPLPAVQKQLTKQCLRRGGIVKMLKIRLDRRKNGAVRVCGVCRVLSTFHKNGILCRSNAKYNLEEAGIKILKKRLEKNK